MEAVLVMLACACAAVAVVLTIVAIAPELVRAGSVRARARTTRRARELAVSACELLGHWAPFVRLCNRPWARRLGARLVPVCSRVGLSLTTYGGLAALVLACLASCVACALLSGSLLGVPVGLAACGVGAAALLGGHERAQRGAATAQMPEVLRCLSAALGAGKSLPQAIAYVGTSLGEPMGSEFLRASFEIEGGRRVEDAVRSLCERVRAPGIELLGTALQVSQRTGSPLNDLFVRTARMVSSSVALRRELMVKTSQARLSSKVVVLMPALLVGILTLISPDYRAGLTTSAGGACLCVAALLDLVALTCVRVLMRRSLR